MLSTLIIGLREGLEAALIVGIVAAFLKRNGHSLRPMWVGVAGAVAASIAVGIALMLATTALPQAQQEALETVIGAVAVVFVTTMILWMDTHSRELKGTLESETKSALSSGSATALAVMAFLAVLKEGFETSVFLLATVQATGSSALGLLGAAIGILIAVGLGIGIYYGGVKLNLGKFFRITGVFLVLVAAGLVMSTLRTAHEAGWINTGQGTTLDLSWLIPAGSVQSALVTGVLGIPRDPRLIEVVGWATYLVAVLVYLLWPRTHKARRPVFVPAVFAGAFASIALTLLIAVPSAAPISITPLNVRATTGATTIDKAISGTTNGKSLVISSAGGTADDIKLSTPVATTHENVPAYSYSHNSTSTAITKTATLTELAALNGGRVPVGLDRTLAPGPYRVTIRTNVKTNALVADGLLLSFSATPTNIITVSGGGLSTAKTFTSSTGGTSIATTDAVVSARTEIVRANHAEAAELALWKYWLPLAYLAIAVVILGSSLLSQRRRARAKATATGTAGATKPTYPTSIPAPHNHILSSDHGRTS